MSCKCEKNIFNTFPCLYKWKRQQCSTSREKKPHPPFNIGVSIDSKIGLHPKFYSQGKDTLDVDYHNSRNVESKSQPISWKRQIESKEFSESLGDRLLDKYRLQRNLMKTGRGPGTHDIPRWPENLLDAPCKGITDNVGFGTVPLFGSSCAAKTPGPGYTPEVHDPYYYLDQNRGKSFSCIPPFEFDGLRPRFQLKIKPWSLAPNRYNVKHPDSLESFLKKVTGRRGPYDLFTGPRDESTIRGYLVKKKLEDRGEWPKKLPSDVEKLLHKSNYYQGQWSTCPRFLKRPALRITLTDVSLCYKDPNHPGPNYYDPKSPRKPKNAGNYPFDSSVMFARPIPKSEIRPGPGRYRIKEPRRIKGHGWTCVFKSKTQRKAFSVTPNYSHF